MSDHQIIDRILAGLLRQTDAKQLRWQRTVEINEFQTKVDGVCLKVGCSRTWTSRTPTQFHMHIVSDDGTTVETLQTADNDESATHTLVSKEQTAMLSELYVKARNMALNTQETLTKLAQALEHP